MILLTFQNARLRLTSLTIFRGLLADPVIASFSGMLEVEERSLASRVSAYAQFASDLLATGSNWSDYLLNKVLTDENPYVLRLAARKDISESLSATLAQELASLELLSQMTPQQAQNEIGSDLPLAIWENSILDFTGAYHARMARMHEVGYGIFSHHHMFLLGEEGLLPVRHPDKVDLSGFTGYERERALVEANTKALLEGRPAANVLLYGDSGTGKSTCVKALANTYKDRGLRLVELRKDQLNLIPGLIDRLSANPLKFILFIDDLSFTQNSDLFSSLKAILEGSISAKTPNMVIYATSNRRHLIRERFSERDGDDVHLRDTLEELSSLSDRFGLTVTFSRPDKELYLRIAEGYCRKYGMEFTEATRTQAEAYAISRGGRSARAARQFAEGLAATR